LTGIPLRIAEPAVVTRAGWQCPGCRTYYSPDVQSCRCAATQSLSERLKRERQRERQRERIQLGGALIRFPPEVRF
jgi:hypothetical protein